jgi:hypothetical protein
MFLLLCFGSLLWPIAIIAVIWGFVDGLIPAIRAKQYEKGMAILSILMVTIAIILLSAVKQGIYLTGFIVPVILLNLYINKYIQLPDQHTNDFHSN